MIQNVIKTMAILTLSINAVHAQDLPESQVPSVILNNFKQEFPKASDVEWERQGNQYNVDFEIGFFTDYEAWFTENKTVTYKVEIEKRNDERKLLLSPDGKIL